MRLTALRAGRSSCRTDAASIGPPRLRIMARTASSPKRCRTARSFATTAAATLELYADGVGDGAPVRQEMRPVPQLTGATGRRVYSTTGPVGRKATDYTVRLIPRHDGAVVPLEAGHILWQR